MKQRPRIRGPGSEQTTITDECELTAMLSALEDADCRAIMAATSEQSLSANELSETCELPLSTTYRKLDTLTEVGLLEENIRISSTGKHASEYTLAVDDLQLSVDGQSGVELHVSHDEQADSGSSLVAGAD